MEWLVWIDSPNHDCRFTMNCNLGLLFGPTDDGCVGQTLYVVIIAIFIWPSPHNMKYHHQPIPKGSEPLPIIWEVQLLQSKVRVFPV
jgi:hypothetical protein